ncbi:restriction endonuclease subunit S [Vibrio antiquarius]|uniref:restriction endonuclease subunit S n=1 Tax=Vibrio antiquarius (strain Ex25) TaxID=150340 RepID=UPI0009408DED|nr:restriction endonuclease subunit S [Vibrio antiquarius]OKQ17566.1 restriction endonuclease subunit S [Vibrio antiquarius]
MTGRYKAYPTYKSSTFEWLGDIPKHWDVVYSKWLFSERKVKAQPTDEMLTASQKYGVIPQKVFMDLEQQKVVQVQKGHDILKQVKKNDFVISMRSFQGGIEFCDYDGAVSSAYVPLESRNNGYSTYFKYLFKSKPYIQALQATTNLVRDGQALRFTNFTQVRLPLPTESEAQCIGTFLYHETAKIDTLITKQEKLIELLKEKRQAVISHAVTKGLNPDVPMKDSGVEWLGDVPEHWDVTKFSYAIDFLEGPGILAADFHDEGVPLLRIQNVKEVFVTDNFKTYLDPLKVKEKWDHFRVEKGDLLISASASTGLISEVDERTVGAVPYTGLIRLKPMTQDITRGFIRYVVQSDLFYEQIKLLQTGSTIQHFGPIHLQQMKVILPPVDEQDRIVDQIQQSVKHIDSLIESAYRIIDLTKERKTALISAAVTGKIDVRDWQEPTYQESA